MSSKSLSPIVAALAVLMACTISTLGQGTAFTYQGRLNDSGNQANGIYDLRFTVYDAVSNGTTIAGPLTNLAMGVTNGVFTVTLDFGAGVFTGQGRWLELGVRTNGGGGGFATLSPRQQLTPSPYAIYTTSAGTVTGVVAVSNLPANVALLNGNQIYGGASQFTNASNAFNGSFAGNGAGVTNVPFAALNFIGTFAWTGIFRPGPSPVTGSNPAAVAAADLNGDGRLDLVCADYSDGTVIVFTNNGAGGFVPFATNNLPVNAMSFCVAVADVNGDGKMDVITANSGNNTVTILTNNGSGVLVLETNLTAVSVPFWVVAADINGDNWPDLICANDGDGTLSVFTNNRSGGFVLASRPGVGSSGSQPVSVAVADVNNDGRPDLISANFGTNTLSVLTNNGNGTFTLSSSPVVGSQPHSVVAADVNGDGRMDLVCANYGATNLMVLTNNGSGVFTVSSTNKVGAAPISVVAANLTSDKFVDLVCANNGTNTLTVLTNNGSGRFAVASSPLVGTIPHMVFAADLDGDGRTDLVCPAGSSNLFVFYNTPSLNVGTLAVSGGLTVNSNLIFIAPNGTNVGINQTNPFYTLDVNGTVNASGNYFVASDLRYKTNVETVTGAFDKIMALRGVEYDWRREDFPGKNFNPGRQIGFIAQEVGRVLPEAVSLDAAGRYSVAYTEVIPVVVEALKEQQLKTEAAMKEKDEKIADLERRLAELERLVAGMNTNAASTQRKLPVAP